MRMVDLILKKRAGQELNAAEINWFTDGFTKGEIPDYQVSALMMAIYFKGMNSRETVDLVKAMINSGDTIDLSGISGKKVDKHSTGGVGDKTSIVLGPMVAACGLPVAKLSGRGLGHTGGTLDKLESFTGFRVELSMAEFIQNVNDFGIAIVSQTGNLVPADKKLYALRDVTGTVENLSLIAGSIMSKKLASGAEVIVLDVKTGSGAFMKDPKDAFQLAEAMVDIGVQMGRKTVALVSDMEQPLGNAIGNALEIKEAIASLQGNGPKDLMELCMALGSQMLIQSDFAKDEAEARAQLTEVIESEAALDSLKDMVYGQGGDPEEVDRPSLLPGAAHEIELLSPSDGFVSSLPALGVGRASMQLGAGRETKSSPIDLGAGILLRKKIGDAVQKGEVLATLYTNTEDRLEPARDMLAGTYQLSAEKAEKRPLILGHVGL